MLLYKYCRPDRIDVLQSGRICLSRPRVFNDPFELHPHISKFAHDPGEMYHHILEKTNPYVVLALAENCESLLMWAHYTDAYRGFIIGFEGPEGILTSPSEHRDFGPVYYGHHRPTRMKFGEVTNQELFYTKSTEWAYEREWRIVDSHASADGDCFDGDGNCWPFVFNSQSVRRVIMGYRARPDLVNQLIDVLREARYAHVELEFAAPHPSRFELTLFPQDRAIWDELLNADQREEPVDT